MLADVAVFLAAAGFKLPEKLRALGSVPTMQEAQAAAPVSAEPVRPAAVPAPTAAAPAEAAAAMPTRVSQAAEKEAREDARLAHCEAVGLVFDKDPLRPLPYGIASAAASLDPPITRQSISTDVKAALRRRFEGDRNGRG